MTAEEINKVQKTLCAMIDKRIQEQQELKEKGLDDLRKLECNGILIGLNWAKGDVLLWSMTELTKLW